MVQCPFSKFPFIWIVPLLNKTHVLPRIKSQALWITGKERERQGESHRGRQEGRGLAFRDRQGASSLVIGGRRTCPLPSSSHCGMNPVTSRDAICWLPVCISRWHLLSPLDRSSRDWRLLLSLLLLFGAGFTLMLNIHLEQEGAALPTGPQTYWWLPIGF